MKTIFAVAALAALAAAGPAKHRRGACPAINKPSQTWSEENSQPTVDSPTSQPTQSQPDTSTGGAVCPNDGGKSLKAGGSCGCEYSINCDSRADHGSGTKFWEKTSGQIVLSLAECLAICDENALCQAVIWVDDSTASSNDYHRCWQTSGLGAIIDSGYGQISYKGSCSGNCAGSYSNA